MTDEFALDCTHYRALTPRPSIKRLESLAITAPVHSFFIVHQLLENFTHRSRRKQWSHPPRTHLYGSGSLSHHLGSVQQVCTLCGFHLKSTSWKTLREKILMKSEEFIRAHMSLSYERFPPTGSPLCTHSPANAAHVRRSMLFQALTVCSS